MNFFQKNEKLIRAIAEKFGCTMDVAKDRLKADLLSGGDGESGGLIPAEVRAEAERLGSEGIHRENSAYFEIGREKNVYRD